MAGELFNGMFNTLIMGLPGWIWAALLVGMILIFSNAYWWFLFWNPLKPLQGLWHANWNKTDAAILSDVNLNLKLVSEKFSKVIFNESITDAKKGEEDWKDITSGQIGITGTDIIMDLGKWTSKTSEERYIIEEAADKWNIKNPNDQVHSFSKFIEYVSKKKIEVDIKTSVLIDWIRIESAFPKMRKKAAYAGYIRQLAEKFDKEEKMKMDGIALYIIIAGVVVSVLFIIGKFLLHKPV